MSKKNLFIFVFINLYFFVENVYAITISTCSALNTDYGVYTLTADIKNSGVTVCMNITANHVILDCQGHTIDGMDTLHTYGINISRSSATTTNITIKNCIVTDWDYGIYLSYAQNNTLTNNTANSNSFGIYLSSSSNYNNITNNTVNSNANYAIWLSSSSNNTISNNTANSNSRGIYLSSSSNYNNITNNTVNSNGYGIYLSSSSNNTISNNTVNNNSYYGIYLFLSSNYNTISNNTVNSNSFYGIYLDSASSNTIYNNLFNNTVNFYFYGTIYPNYWNTTRQTGTRIYSPGTEIGGNYWTNPTGNGYSDTCTDADQDGFCDSYYELDATGPNIDYLPLSNKYSADTTPPTYSLNSTNSTLAGTAVSHNLYWQDDTGLSYAIFSFDNCTGSLQNITGMSLSGSSAWSNFTVVINSTVGCTIRWCVYANDTSNNWNGTSCQNPFSYTTSSVSSTLQLNATKVWWNDSVLANGYMVRNGQPANGTLSLSIDNQVYCSNVQIINGNWNCTFLAPLEIRTYTVVINFTDDLGNPGSTSTTLTVSPFYGRMPTRGTISILEQYAMIQDMNGKIKKVRLLLSVWR